MARTFVYKRFERFWHWSQALLIAALALTGFEVHGTYHLLGFERAVRWHNGLAEAFIVLIIFAVFWHFTTGEWRQYIPTRAYLADMARFYLTGIFRGAPHPVKKTLLAKLNPLQRLTYLGLKVLILPVQVTSGLLYYSYNHWKAAGVPLERLSGVALVHTAGAFLLLAFLVSHVYLTTTGHSLLSNIKAMITGWEEIEEEQVPLAPVLAPEAGEGKAGADADGEPSAVPK